MNIATTIFAADGEVEVRALGGGVLVIACDMRVRLRSAARLETLAGTAPAPLTTLRLPLANGGTRVLWALRPEVSERPLVLRAFTGVLAAGRLVDIQPGARYRIVELASLADGLAPEARISLVSALLGVWSSVFHLRRDASFLRAIRKLTGAIAAAPAGINLEAEIAGGRGLLRTVLPLALGDVRAVYALTARGIEHLPHRWYLSAPQPRGRVMRLVAPADFAADDRLIIVGANGVAVRLPRRPPKAPALAQWWHGQLATAGDRLREFIAHALADGSPAGRAASLEFQMRAPLRARQLAGRNGTPSLTVELALAGPAGLLVSGSMRDPQEFVAGLEAEDDAGTVYPVAWHQFQGRASDRNISPPAGFIGMASGYRSDAPILQPRLFVKLITGARHAVVPRQQPAGAIARRALVLRALPQQHLSDAILSECLAPVLSELQKEIRSLPAAAAVEQLGEPVERPECSVVVPLYRNLSFLKAQVAAFAADPAMNRSEIVYVLDSPEQAGDVLHLLRGLHLLYGTPIALVTMARNAGYAAACNTGARIARGRALAMLNSDVIPMATSWLPQLSERLTGRVGIVGPKLLFEDNSIQHAGMYFSRNQFGHWINHHFHKGMPRGFAPATIDRLVPGVTGACLIIRRDLFEAVGGFTEDYVIGDYEDSDLCLKARRAGYDIGYVAGVELYHLERQSIRQSEDYMRGSADRYNGWLHAQRWAEDMRQIMNAAGTSNLRSAA